MEPLKDLDEAAKCRDLNTNQESLVDTPPFHAKIQRLDGLKIAKGWLELSSVPTRCQFSPENEKCVWDTKSYPEVTAKTEDGREIHLYDWLMCANQIPGFVGHFHFRLEP
ncbi:MAG: hypothetical protein ABSG59_16270 [Verrucomicrobiota bacterium]|jgi:hypothetical protein